MSFHFVSQNGTTSVGQRRAVRSQAMKSFWRQQFEARQHGEDSETKSNRTKLSNQASSSMRKSKRLLPAGPLRLPEKEMQTSQDTESGDSQPLATPESLIENEVQPAEIKEAADDHPPADESAKSESLDAGEYSTIERMDSPVCNLTQISKIAAVQACRDQIYQTFVKSYYADSIIASNHQVITTRHWLPPENAAMNAARTALSLLHLGTCFQDQNLLYEGCKIHCEALKLIRREIERCQINDNDFILGACYTLAHCQIYRVMSEQGLGWQIHMPGVYYLLRKRGATSISSPFAQAIFHNVRQIAAMNQLLKRKRTFLSFPDWQTKPLGAQHPSFQLTNVAFEVSAVLEDLDKLGQRFASSSGTDAKDIHTRIETLEDRLLEWLHGGDLGLDCAPYKFVRINAFPQFEERCGDFAALLPHVYGFNDFVSATVRCYIWTLLINLQNASIEMLRTEMLTVESSSLRYQIAALTHEANETAYHLLRSVAFLSTSQHRSAGILACSSPLYWAEDWFNRQGAARMQQLCTRIRESLESDSPAPLNLRRPVFTWWMLPSIFGDRKTIFQNTLEDIG